VRDNGVGITPDVAPRVFDPFFTTRPSGQGAGLGLSISYDVIVQGHQGEMRIASKPGDHTEVFIALPAPAR
jgi:signal transduction histidine kinase